MSSFLLHFWRITLLNVGLLVDSPFHSALWTCRPTTFWPVWVYVGNKSLLSCCFADLLFGSGFCQFGYSVSWCGCLRWCCLDFMQLFGCADSCLLSSLEEFGGIISLNVLSNLPLLSFWSSHDALVSSLESSAGLWGSVHFPLIFLPSTFEVWWFLSVCLQVHWCLWHLKSALEPI